MNFRDPQAELSAKNLAKRDKSRIVKVFVCEIDEGCELAI